jgi:uncharacterized protein
MSPDILGQIFRWVFDSGLARQPFTLLWHAGEPFVLPVSFYETAAELLRRHNVAKIPVLQSFQTNATLVDVSWCSFLQRPDVHLGVSVDGPDFLHDRYRRTRQGRGTLDRVLRGIELLHEHCISFDVITVLTFDSLAYPDELFDFYKATGIASVAFNVEEVEGPNRASTLQRTGTPERFHRFLARFMTLARAANPPLLVREFTTSVAALLGVRQRKPISRTQENKPWAIVNIDCDGNLSTYSPELLGISSSTHGPFSLGNVTTDRLEAIIESARFKRLEEEIGCGIEMCRASCPYFPVCGGGAPAHKFFENGTFASTETLCCRLHKKVCIDVTLELLEQEAKAASASAPREQAPQPERALP